MAFCGRYGNLPTLEAAQLSLKDIADNCTWEDLRKADTAENIPVSERYDSIRLNRMIIGLQMVIFRNGGKQPDTWLPMLYEPQGREAGIVSLPDHSMEQKKTNTHYGAAAYRDIRG